MGERRSSYRIPVRAKAVIYTENSEIEANVTDVAYDGIAIELPDGVDFDAATKGTAVIYMTDDFYYPEDVPLHVLLSLSCTFLRSYCKHGKTIVVYSHIRSEQYNDYFVKRDVSEYFRVHSVSKNSDTQGTII